jgi:hypothetical protein
MRWVHQLEGGIAGIDRPRKWRLVASVAVLLLVFAGGLRLARWPSVLPALPGAGGVSAVQVEIRQQHEQPLARLAIVGDVGTGKEAEWATARLIAESAQTDPFDGLVLLGDNVYPNGDPHRLDATVFDPFAEVLDTGAALLPVLGNHDVRDGHAEGQVAGLGMPGRWYSSEIGPALFIGLDSNLVDDPEQRRWLEASLAQSSSEFIVVAMHHPAYSAGFHGSDKSVQESWVPLFEEYDVSLVLAGHDHDYQRSVPLAGVTYVVSGAGAKLRPAGRDDFTAFSASVHHFVDLGLWTDRIELRAISQRGQFDHITIGPAGEGSSTAEPAAPITAERSHAETAGLQFDDDARTAALIGVAGLTIWALALLVGSTTPTVGAIHLERACSVGTTLGLLVTTTAMALAFGQTLT